MTSKTQSSLRRRIIAVFAGLALVCSLFALSAASPFLEAPASVTSTVTASGKLQINWSSVRDASSYQVLLQKTGTWKGHMRAAKPQVLVLTETSHTSCSVPVSALTGLYRSSADEVAGNRASVAQTDGYNPDELDVAAFSTKDNARLTIAVVACAKSLRSPQESHPLPETQLARIPLKPAGFARQQGAATAMTMADGSTSPRFAYQDSSGIDWATYKAPPAAITAAQVPYPVNGSTDFVKFLASNLMAGNRYLDATRFSDASDAGSVDDALSEAVDQNPYILYDSLWARSIKRDHKTFLFIETFYRIKDYQQQQQQLWERVQSVDAQIITPGMSDVDKAQAINSWLIDNASYDLGAMNAALGSENAGGWDLKTAQRYYTEHPYTQNALGVMLHGSGVCASYAAAFKALADRAGLPCVFVTGTISSSGQAHAWNKVQLYGRWLIVDSSWNDVTGDATRYFGLADDNTVADRSQNNEFMLDAYVSRYAN
ncbi:MAG: hypothetical protein FWC54_04980 [Actinomycetia bacterium]|nr:hypothetical protein [Actinomycetes bacterium]